jgi:EAL domain-containing protein (putative c-di-GMP-specific phosphodiesterase class I)
MRLVLTHKAPEFMSVNLSRAQLRQPQLIDQVHEVMQRWEVKPEHLILEVTESLAAQDGGVKAALNDLRGLGIALSLDDFGTGYSSLSCLHELPVNIVKIDRSFVVEAMESDFHRVMIEATMRMANTLNLSTVAEGIEHEDQAELMRLLGLQKGQGYLFSKPLPLAEMIDFLDAQVDKAGFLPKNLVLST